MPYTQFVEFGRIAVVTYGPLADKPVVIVDIIDDKRVLIDVPNTNESRQVIPVKRLRLTDIVVKIDRAAAPEAVAQAIKAEKALEKWNGTKWAKRLAANNARLQLNDFQRFKHAQLEAKRAQLVKEQLAKH
ncbi:ribosomal protein L14 [Tritrichomonas foetus]|uniref:Ribosomal protein L14 n=1 Tax=Tritrichomonas foetus TaxID=1144522 RepID=A0A1J4KNY8_9EUKA|nr:ribosomal protein L14 [Tritrichomonas foetus]|eukprot:OHT12640.1 ribosomal protein L14 [Tritrichomonas foetus]